jgi:hypothetical protein
MLLEPWSTVTSVRNNLRFLSDFAGDGATPISFCRTLPYAGTPLETKLKAEGRLIARDFSADYRFLDPRLDVFYDWTLDAFSVRNHSSAGTANLLRLMIFQSHLRFPETTNDAIQRERIRHLCSLSNKLLLETSEMALDAIESNPDDSSGLGLLSRYHAVEDERLQRDLASLACFAAGHSA